MFIIMGIKSKINRQGIIGTCPCPVCGARYALNVMHKYMTPHVFFIPTFRFHSEYVAVCEHCASVMELAKEKGRALKKDPTYPVNHEDLKLLQNNMRRKCPNCDEIILPNQKLCPNCGGATEN